MLENRSQDKDNDGPFIFGSRPDDESDETEVSAEVDLGRQLEEEDDEEFEPEHRQPGIRKERESPEEEPLASRKPYRRPVREQRSQQLKFETALKIVELKFRFWQYFLVYVIASAILAAINQIMRVRSGYTVEWWVQWPLLVYAVFLIIPFCRAYLFRGQDLRSMVEEKLRRMAEREMARSEIYDE